MILIFRPHREAAVCRIPRQHILRQPIHRLTQILGIAPGNHQLVAGNFYPVVIIPQLAHHLGGFGVIGLPDENFVPVCLMRFTVPEKIAGNLQLNSRCLQKCVPQIIGGVNNRGIRIGRIDDLKATDTVRNQQQLPRHFRRGFGLGIAVLCRLFVLAASRQQEQTKQQRKVKFDGSHPTPPY